MFRSFVIAFISIILFGGCANSQGNAPKTVPEFTFFNILDGQPIMRTSLAIEGNIAFVFFDTGCIHCRNEISLIGDNFSKFENVTFYLVSQQDEAIVNDFINTYGSKIQGKANVHVLLDKNYEFLTKFKPIQYPAIYVYGPDRKLKSYLDGENELGKIVSAVNK